MGDKFTIQISANLVNQLAKDGDKLKKKTKKPKSRVLRQPKPSTPEVTQKQSSEESETLRGPAAGWQIQPPLYFPVPPSPQSANEELNDIRSALQYSEKTVEKLQKKEEDMLQEVTQRAKDLHDKEFKLPEPKPIPCVEEKDGCLECYKENPKNPLKCSSLVNDFANCVRRARQQVGTANQ